MKPIVTGSLAAVAVLSLTANALMYLRYSTSRPLVTVGSQVITKKNYQDAVNAQTQGGVLRKMVLADLVTQAAAAAHVLPSDADVDARIAEIRRADPQALSGADADPARMADFRQDVRENLALDNLRMQGVTVSAGEVAEFYAQHKAAFSLQRQVQTVVVATQNDVDAAAAAGLLQQSVPVDVIARQPRLHVVGMDGFTVNMSALPPATAARFSTLVLHMNAGQVRTFPADAATILVVKAARVSPTGTPPLSQIAPMVTKIVRLQKAPSEAAELAKLYRQAPPVFSVAKYQTYFTDLDGAAPDEQQVASAQ